MPLIALTMVSPTHNQVIDGGQDVAFSAHRAGVGPGPDQLHVRWYSSLPASGLPDNLGTPPDLDKIALNPLPDSWSFSRRLLVGSQAITVAVKDRPGDDEAALKAVRHAGMAGGGPDAAAPCVVHVLLADSIEPAPPAAPQTVTPMTRAAGIWAQGPPTWRDPDYQKLNRLGYSWTFAPAVGDAVALRPSADELEFRPRQDGRPGDPRRPLPPRVGFSAIPASLRPGEYRMTLRVVYTPDPARSAQVGLDVRILD